jgi:hypothetical protein
MVITLNDCELCNRVKISIDPENYPAYEGRVIGINKDDTYEVRLKDNLIVYIKPQYIIDIIPCPIEEKQKINGEAIERWLST